MTAHASTAHAIAPRIPIDSRSVLVRRSVVVSIVGVMVVAALLMIGSERLSTAGHTVCTIGTPAGTTCGEALVLLGYP